MGVSNHLPRSELECQSKVTDASGHVTLEIIMSFLITRMMMRMVRMVRMLATLMRTFLDLKSL